MITHYAERLLVKAGLILPPKGYFQKACSFNVPTESRQSEEEKEVENDRRDMPRRHVNIETTQD